MSDKLWVVTVERYVSPDEYERWDFVVDTERIVAIATTREDARRLAAEAIGQDVRWCEDSEDDPDYDEAYEPEDFECQGWDCDFLSIRGYPANAVFDWKALNETWSQNLLNA